MAVIAAAALATASARLAPASRADYAANCKAIAHAMQQNLSVEQDAWRDFEADWSFWDGRHRDAERDPARRRAQDAAAEVRVARLGLPRSAMNGRGGAQLDVRQCRQMREAIQ